MSLLLAAYPWVKTLHVLAVISWMAGLLYLPRLFVYHAQTAPFSEAAERFKKQQRLLLQAIMVPAMVVAWLTGAWLAATPGVVAWADAWPWVKLAGIAALTASHHVFARWRRDLSEERRRPGRHYRIANEVPTLAMALVVAMVIARPG
jgi:putative membrane protein